MTTNNTSWPEVAYLNVLEAAAFLGISRSSIYARLDQKKPKYFDPKFPRPKKFGENAVRFSRAELLRWADERPNSGGGSV